MVRLQMDSIAQEAMELNLAKEGYTAFYVDGTDGLDTYPGDSWEQPFKTIQHAVDEAESWAKIFVKAGTYTERIWIKKDYIHIIGESRTTTIISLPTNWPSGHKIDGNKCSVVNATVKSEAPQITTYTMGIYGDYNIFADCEVMPEGVGVVVSGDRNRIVNIDETVVPLSGSAIVINGDHNDISECHIDGAEIGISATGSVYNKIYDNEIKNCTAIGIRIGSSDNSIFHNNLINNTTQITDTWSDNKWFENFYDNHTADTNNDGLCDTPYSEGGATDHQPVSRRNGWKQESLGYDSATANSLTFKGTVTTATSATVFASTDLAGYGNDAFINDWYVYVFHDAGGAGAAPQGESQPISDYVSSTGTFTHTAFTADLALTDEVFIIHSSVLANFEVPSADTTDNVLERDVIGNKTDTAVTVSGTTKSIMAYVKGAITELGEVLDLTRSTDDVAVTDSETDLYFDDTPTKTISGLSIKIDTSLMQAADTYDFKIKYRIESAGAYLQQADTLTYTGVQSAPLKVLGLEPYRYGLEITAQRTAGANRSFKIEVFREA